MGYAVYADNGSGSNIDKVVYDGINNPSETKVYINNLKTRATYRSNVILL